MSSLFLYTNAFPCDKALEHYIEHEMPFLSKSFDKIYIFPGDFSTIKIPVPQNVSVINIYDAAYYKSSAFRLIFAMPYLVKVLSIEFFNTEINKWLWLKKIKSSVVGLYNAYECANATKSFLKIKQLNVEQVCFYSYWLYHPALFLAILKDKNIIPSFISRGHQAEVYDYAYPEKNVFKYFKLLHVSKVFLISEHAKKYLSTAYPKFKNKFEVAYLGVQNNGVNPSASSNQVFTIVSCSKFAPHKRIHLIPEMLKELKFKTRWVHLGYIPNEIIEEYKVVLKQSSVVVETEFLGDLANHDVLEFYKNNHTDVFINVSSVEGLSVALMEACSYGITLLATDINGTAEIVNENSGYLLPLNFKISDAVTILNNIHSDNRYQKRDEARKMFLERFDSNKNFTQFIQNIKAIN